jgi:hypothetical protein
MEDLPSQSEFDMFCWGNTVNGELGLGGIEEEHILLPRELNFNQTTNIKEGEFNGLCTHTHTHNKPVVLTQKDQLLHSSKRRPHFRTHKWSWNKQKFGPGP